MTRSRRFVRWVSIFPPDRLDHTRMTFRLAANPANMLGVLIAGQRAAGSGSQSRTATVRAWTSDRLNSSSSWPWCSSSSGPRSSLNSRRAWARPRRNSGPVCTTSRTDRPVPPPSHTMPGAYRPPRVTRRIHRRASTEACRRVRRRTLRRLYACPVDGVTLSFPRLRVNRSVVD